MIEANRASSSAKEVSISTLVWGRAARMSRVASMPEPSERRTSMTITSGRAWAATATASRTEPASAHTTTSEASTSSSLMPSRTTSWSSTSMTRSGGALMALSSQGWPGWLKPARFVISGRISVRASSLTGDMLLAVGLGLIGDRLADPVQEVLDGCLGHPVQQHPVDRPPEDTQGWPVAGADGQLGPILAQRTELDVGIQPGEHALQPDRLPGQGQRGHGGKADRLADLDGDPPTEPGPKRSDPDLGEQMIAAPLGFAGNHRQPVGRRIEHGMLDLPGRQGQLHVIANEHASRVDPAEPGS